MTTEYQGCEITLTETFKWQVEGSDRMPFDSYTLATEYIDEKVKAEEAQNRRRTKIAAIGESRKEYVVTGINVKTGALLTTPKLDEYGGESIYMDTPTCRLLLTALREAEQRASKLRVLLRPFRLEGVADTYKGFEHGAAVDVLEKTAKRAEKIVMEDLERTLAETKLVRKLRL